MTTSAGSEAGHPAERRRWTWDLSVSPRWLLLGDVGFECFYEDDRPLALCAEIEGLFVDLPPRPQERFTLVGCAPDGALADLLDRLPAEVLGTERAWLGDLSITAPPPPPGMPPPWHGADLGDLIVVGQRSNRTLPGTVDIDLDGFIHVYDRTEAVERPGGITQFVLLGQDETPYGTCRDVTGVFREQAAPLVPQVRLLGCRPETPLLAALDAVGQSTKASLRRRRIRAEAHMIAADGSAARVIDAVVSGTVAAGEPSRLGVGLLDVTVDSDPQEPLPTGILGIVEHWHNGPPAQRNMWAGYDRGLRHHWALVALAHQSDVPDRPAGTTYDLDGRFVTDIEGFYCAIGEAINGPGGYFGCNLDAFDDCLCGKFGARTPFRLVWHDSAVAREHLVAGYDRRRLGPAVTLEYLLGIFAQHDVEIDLR
ncbi:barstar family protein [Micromonospora mirobrigensis]|uniref:Barstar (Barnase inhibitor) n=1 Tax=Micromonospora mirobrigensis TaxID=262898 RepID=A0A1C4YZP9_9ACTN|nr:barstar family protein [Micromonospora mirobrigensis]SCF26116.1 Barstar (barnase inhibitor) [Micromonospora mirobrigensis]